MKKTTVNVTAKKENRPLKIFKSWIVCGCVIYTFIALALLILFPMFSESDTIPKLRFILILPCALTASIGVQIYRSEGLSKTVRFFANYFFTTMGIFLFLIVPIETENTQMKNFLFLLLITLVYWIFFLIYLFFKSKIKKLTRG